MINVLYIQMTLTRNHVWAVVPINKYKQNSKNKHIYMSTWSTSWENANWSLSDCVLCMYKQRYSANLCKLCVLYHCKYHKNVSTFFHCIVLWNCTVCHITFEKKFFFPSSLSSLPCFLYAYYCAKCTVLKRCECGLFVLEPIK